MTTAEGRGMVGGANNRGGAGKAEMPDDHRFVALDYQLAMASEIADRVVRKHWHLAEREQAQFRNGIIGLLLLGVLGAFTKDIQWVGLIIAALMLIGVVILLIVHLGRVQRRFDRMWSSVSSDGELFRFVRDSGLALGHPVEMGKPEETFKTHLDVEYPKAVEKVEEYLRSISMGEQGAPPGLYVPGTNFKQSVAGESQKVYEVEFRGVTVAPVSFRISAADAGTEITIGFPLRISTAESREKMIAALRDRLQDRFLAAELLGDFRAACGVPRLSIPATETSGMASKPQMSRAI